MPVAYFTVPGTVLRVVGRTLRATQEDATIAEIEMIHLEAVVIAGGVAVTTPAQAALLAEGVPLVLLDRRGSVRGRLSPATPGTVDVRIGQHRVLSNPAERLVLARRLVASKIDAQLEVVRSLGRERGDLPIAEWAGRLERSAESASTAADRAILRGIEGAATALWWTAFAALNGSPLRFSGRNRRPPRDPMNALLSFGYAIVTSEAHAVLEAAGLDPWIGVMHDLRPHRPALALDLIEPWRHAWVDRAVLAALHGGRFDPDDFEGDETTGVVLGDGNRRTLIKVLEQAASRTAPTCLQDRNADGAGTESVGGRDGAVDTRPTLREALRRRAIRLATWFRRRSGLAASPIEPSTEEVPR